MVKFTRSRNPSRLCAYESMNVEVGASPKWTHSFDKDDMIDVVVRLLASQKRPDDLRHVLDRVRNGSYYFFDLDLTAEEAESLGFPFDASISTLHPVEIAVE